MEKLIELDYDQFVEDARYNDVVGKIVKFREDDDDVYLILNCVEDELDDIIYFDIIDFDSNCFGEIDSCDFEEVYEVVEHQNMDFFLKVKETYFKHQEKINEIKAKLDKEIWLIQSEQEEEVQELLKSNKKQDEKLEKLLLTLENAFYN